MAEFLIFDQHNANERRPQFGDVICIRPDGFVFGGGDLKKCRQVSRPEITFEDAFGLDNAGDPEGSDDENHPGNVVYKRYRLEADGTFTDRQKGREKPVRGVPLRPGGGS
jgi:hypothetical protein